MLQRLDRHMIKRVTFLFHKNRALGKGIVNFSKRGKSIVQNREEKHTTSGKSTTRSVTNIVEERTDNERLNNGTCSIDNSVSHVTNNTVPTTLDSNSKLSRVGEHVARVRTLALHLFSIMSNLKALNSSLSVIFSFVFLNLGKKEFEV